MKVFHTPFPVNTVQGDREKGILKERDEIGNRDKPVSPEKKHTFLINRNPSIEQVKEARKRLENAKYPKDCYLPPIHYKRTCKDGTVEKKIVIRRKPVEWMDKVARRKYRAIQRQETTGGGVKNRQEA